MSIADNAKNTAEDLKGRAKEAAGAVTGDEELKAEGQADQVLATVKQAVTDLADKAKDGVETMKDTWTGN